MFKPDSNILILDDMMTMRKIVGKALKDAGFSKITEAEDGVKGWAAITAANPPFDLIVSDWNMPNLSGLELLQKVRADEKYKKLPFILLTAESEVTQVHAAVMAGVDNYIVKPFNVETLKTKLADTFKKVQKRCNL